jgi:putative flavoprotein involved in K+ transport
MTHVVIIGSGPAGLAAAACLKRRGVACTLLERGPVAAAALRKVDPEMALFSPEPLSRLPDMEQVSEARYPTFRELTSALDRYREQHALDIVPGCEVTAVERSGNGFVVRAAAGDHEGTHVISATGLIASPRLPGELDVAASKLRWMHSLDVRRDHIAAARRMLVVGAGASAADVFATWLSVRRPDDAAWIALRSKLRTMPRTVLGIDVHYWVWLFEHLPGRPFGPRLSPVDPVLGGAVTRAIQRGAIPQVSVARYLPASVALTTGDVIEPDLVVLATGFHYNTRHLGDLVERDAAGWPILRRCESPRTPGLYVLGARYARSIASPYLRGIARDAAFVARRIARS